jgi:hypothetical protein
VRSPRTKTHTYHLHPFCCSGSSSSAEIKKQQKKKKKRDKKGAKGGLVAPPPTEPVGQDLEETATGIRLGHSQLVKCGFCGGNGPLEVCTLCGTVAYCSAACKANALPTHSYTCHLLRVNHSPETQECIETLLYDRDFAGYYSMFHRKKFDEMGEGVVVAQLSHPLSEFALPRNPTRTGQQRRTISLSFVQNHSAEVLAREFRAERTLGSDASPGNIQLSINGEVQATEDEMRTELISNGTDEPVLFPFCRQFRGGMMRFCTFTMVLRAPQHMSAW